MQKLLRTNMPFIFCRLLTVIAITIVHGSSIAIAGQDRGGNGVEGRALAEKLCSRCHAIDPGQLSPNPEAPPFQEVAGRWPLSHLEEALAEGISVGHEAMPEFKLSSREIDNLLAYLSSLTR